MNADSAEQAEPPREVIADQDTFLRAVETISAGQGPVAVDAERASGYRYWQRAYLIQVYRRDAGVFLFDAPLISDFSSLQAAIGTEEWVLHAATQDLTCLREVGLNPQHLFDTELAARLSGLERVGLGAVVEELLGIHLAKAHSAADWSTRPLPQSWLEYAALDVELLVDVRDALTARLGETQRLDIARQEFQSVLTRNLTPAREEPWRRLSGLHRVRGARALAVARELWAARDSYAQRVDIAPGRLIPDAAIIAVALATPESKRALAGMREFTGRASRSELDRWWAAIEAALLTDDLPAIKSPSDGKSLPPPRAWSDKNPAAAARLGSAKQVVQDRATALGLPLENLLTPEYLRRLCWEPPQSTTVRAIAQALEDLGARPWQVSELAQGIAEAFVEVTQKPEAYEAAP